MIGIIDYGMGNLYSVSKALERLQVPYQFGEKPSELEHCNGLILPGVGAFPDAMKALNDHEFVPFIHRKVEEGVPLYGICLGMQLLFESSDEGRPTNGLGLFQGHIKRFSGVDELGNSYKVPHMGWNQLEIHKPGHALFDGLDAGHVYFVHSYVVHTDDRSILLATADYHMEVPAIVGKGHVIASQFHPEKSGKPGMQLLENFCTKIVKGDHE